MSKFIPGEVTPKKYVVFELVDYYPSGGLHDIVDSFDELTQAKDFIQRESFKYCKSFEVIDRDTWLEVYRC